MPLPVLRLLPTLCLGLLLALSTPATANEINPIPVVTSFSILADLTKQIGGDLVSVESLVPPDGDAHVYEPTPRDVKKLTSAKLLIINGLGFEGWIDRLEQSSHYHGVKVVASSGITPRTLSEDSDHEEHHHQSDPSHTMADPHAWQDIRLASIYVDNIAKALQTAMPDHQDIIIERTARYKKQLTTLDQNIRRQLSSVPADRRTIITDHDAFGYFGDAYGLTFMAPIGLSTESEPSAASFAALATQMKKNGVKTIFLENMANPRLVRSLAQETGAHVGGTLYADSLSAENGPAPTYTQMMEHNAALLLQSMK